MASVYSAGSASVQIVPDFTNAQRKIGQWFASQKDMKVGVSPDLNQGDMARVHAQVAAHKPKLHINIDKATFAKDLVSTLDFLTGTSMVQKALSALFDVKPILMANLGGAGVALASVLSQAVGAAALAPAAIAALAAPIGTVVVGMQGIGDAFKNLGSDGDPEKLAAALKDLAPSARDFVKEVHSLAPAFKDLRLDVQQHLFDGMGKSLRELGEKGMPVLRKGLAGMADELNLMGRSVFDTLGSPGNLNEIGDIFTNLKATFHEVALAAAPIVDALIDITRVGSDFLPGLVGGFGDLARKFADFIQKAKESGKLEEFMSRALSTIGDVIKVVGNLGSALGSIFSAALPGGQALMEILKLVTGDLAAFLKTDVAQSGLKSFFDGIVQTVGALTPGLEALIQALITGVLPAMSGLASAVAPVVNGVLTDFANLLSELAPMFYPALAEAISTALGALAPLVDVFADLAKTLLPPVIELIKELAPRFSDLAEAVGAGLVDAVHNLAPLIPPLADAFLAVVDALLPMVPAVLDLVNTALPPLVVVLQGVLAVVEKLAPLLPVLVTGFLAWKAVSGVQGMLASFSGTLKKLAQDAAFASYNVGGIGGAAAGRASEGLSRATTAVGKFASALPVIGIVLSAAALQFEANQQKVDSWAHAILEGGKAAQQAAEAAKKAQSSGFNEFIDKMQFGKQTSLFEQMFGSDDEERWAEAKKRADELLAAMSPLEQARSKAAQAQANLNMLLNDEHATDKDVARAKEDLAYWSGEVAIQEGRQGDATKSATDRLKEQANQILEAADAQLAFENSQLRAQDAIASYTQVMNDSTASERDRRQAVIDVQGAIKDAAEAAKRKAEADAAGKTEMEKANAGNQAYLDTMRQLASQLTGPAKDAMDSLIKGLEGTMSVAATTKAQMEDLGVSIDSIPTEHSVIIDAPTEDQMRRLKELGYKVETLPNGQVIVYADTGPAESEIQKFLNKRRTMQIDLALRNNIPSTAIGGFSRNSGLREAEGGIVEAWANGGLRPMKGGIADIVAPDTWRVIGDRVRDDEAYIPINNSPRSKQILTVTADAMGFTLVPNARGNYWMPPGMSSALNAPVDSVSTARTLDRLARQGAVDSRPVAATTVAGFVNNGTVLTTDLSDLARTTRRGTQRALAVAGLK